MSALSCYRQPTLASTRRLIRATDIASVAQTCNSLSKLSWGAARRSAWNALLFCGLGSIVCSVIGRFGRSAYVLVAVEGLGETLQTQVVVRSSGRVVLFCSMDDESGV